jgi:hypothetical protein
MTVAGARGLEVQEGGEATCARCVFERLEEVGVVLANGTLGLEDTIVRDVELRRFDEGVGRGIEILSGDATLTRTRVERARVDGLVARASSTVTATDLEIRDVQPSGDGISGHGIFFLDHASGSFDRLSISRVHEVGLALHCDECEVIGNDIDVSDVESTTQSLAHGRGINLQGTVRFDATRVAVSGVREIGVCASIGATATISDLRVGPVLPNECAATTCESTPAGHGIGVYRATAEIDAFEVMDADFCGIHVAEDGSVEARNGLVHGSQIGACLQSETQAVEDLSAEVRYTDNGLPLDTTMLPVPAPLAADGGGT